MKDSQFMTHTLQSGVYDAIVDGRQVKGLLSKMIYVTSEDDLDMLTDERPGTMAATYGFTSMWQLDDTGTWIEL